MTTTAIKPPKSTLGNKVRIIDSKYRIVIDEERHEFLLDGIEIAMTPKEFSIVAALKRAAKTLSRDAILEAVWGTKKGTQTDTRTVDQHIARLRRKLNARGVLGTDVIKTQNSFGYMYRAI